MPAPILIDILWNAMDLHRRAAYDLKYSLEWRNKTRSKTYDSYKITCQNAADTLKPDPFVPRHAEGVITVIALMM